MKTFWKELCIFDRAFIMYLGYLGYPLKYNGHEYSKVFDLVSWIISAIPYIAIPAAAMHSCGLYEGSCKEVSKEHKGMDYKWWKGLIYGVFNSAMQSYRVKNILHGQKYGDFFFECLNRDHGRIKYDC